MYTAETQLRVRYGETDQMGYIYYGNYAMYYEVGRVEALRQLGITYKAIEEQGIMMPVLESNSRYLRPGRYDELLKIKVTIPELPGVRILFHYELFNEAGELINEGSTRLTFIQKSTHKPCRPPLELMNALKPFFA